MARTMNAAMSQSPQPINPANEPSRYVEKCSDGHWQIAHSRVSLDSIVYAYRDGESPEQIIRSFPGLSTEQVYGAIAFYLANQELIDAYLERQSDRWDRLRAEADQRNSALRAQILSRSLVKTSEDVSS